MKHRRKDADTTVGTTIEGGPFAVSFFWITLVFFSFWYWRGGLSKRFEGIRGR